MCRWSARVTREPFRGQIASWALGDLRTSRVTATPHLASRTRRMIALREYGLYKVDLLSRGSCRLIQDGREAVLRPGDLAVLRLPPTVHDVLPRAARHVHPDVLL